METSTSTPTLPPSPTSGPLEVITPARIQERRAFGFLALGALAALVRLAMPVGMGLFLGALLAFALEPIYARLRKRGMATRSAALVCALGTTTIVSSTVIGMTTLFVTRGLVLLGELRARLAPGGAARGFAENAASRLHLNVGEVSQRLENEAMSLGSRVAGIAAEIAGATFGGLLTLFFMTLAAYFVLRRWNEVVTRLEQMLPFERRHTHALLEQFRSVGREVLLGTVATGLIQGLLAATGYWATGVPEPAFFGALTALASLVPGIGTVLVWGSLGVTEIVSGRVAAGLAELLYSALIVGIVPDYVIRPRLVGRGKGVPAILTFVALFGGVQVFGVNGLILGPVIVTLSFAILKTYSREIAAT